MLEKSTESQNEINGLNKKTNNFRSNTNKSLINKEKYQFKEQNFEDEKITRQDVTIYHFSFVSSCQAISIILGFFMIINTIIYLFFIYITQILVSNDYLFSWIIFTESAILFLFSVVMVHKRTLVVKNSVIKQTIYTKKNNLKFAFIHSFTYLISAICLAILSTLAHFTLI